MTFKQVKNIRLIFMIKTIVLLNLVKPDMKIQVILVIVLYTFITLLLIDINILIFMLINLINTDTGIYPLFLGVFQAH